MRLACLLALLTLPISACTSSDGAGTAASAAEDPSASSAANEVRTIAGTGAPGIADGPAASATFLMPTGLARGKDGTLYISDEAAQRIRTLSPDGSTVATLAGSGAVEPPGLSVKGGYRDGPAAQARFNRPEGLAIAPDGSVYVADQQNACIRKIAHGIVSTVAGKCDARSTNTGGAAQGRLNDPRSLAFDAKGNLYIADYGVGVLRLGGGGRLSKVDIGTGEPQILGIATSVDATGGPVLVASSPALFIERHPASRTGDITNIRNYAEGSRPFGDPYQLTARDGREFFFSDIRSSTVRYLRLPAPPFVSSVFTRTIAGGTEERPIDNVGFRDGSRESARFNAPGGLAVNGDTLYVADSGNRRIRSVALPPIRLSETGVGTGIIPDSKHYEVAYVGASWAFWDSLGDDSFCAHLEDYMNASHKFSKPVRCHAIRIDGASLPEMEDYVKNVLADERFDEIVMNVTPSAVNAIFPNKTPPSAVAAAVGLRAHTESILKTLQPSHAKLLIAWTYEADDVSDTENLYERQQKLNGKTLPGELIDFRKDFALEYDGLRALPIKEYDEFNDILSHERSADPAPLYGTDDSHMNLRGEDYLARHVARVLSGA